MSSPAPTSASSAEAFESLAVLQRLTVEAGTSESRKQLVFQILNRSIAYCYYDRAVLWSLTGTGARLLGVSGQVGVNARSPLVAEWRALLDGLPDPHTAAVLRPETFPHGKDTWHALAKRTQGLSLVWLPIKVRGETVAGLWLERWGQRTFSEGHLPRLELLSQAYGVAWRSVTGPARRWGDRRAARKLAVGWGFGVLVVAALCLITAPLRIVARCEVVPRNPVAVTAPLNGVLNEIAVLPGRPVKRGDLLARYDKRVATEEMKVASEQVQIIESDLRRTRVQAFDDPLARSTVALLENRLEQENIRLQAAERQVERLEIRAPVAGTVMFDDPSAWRGRPVQVGELLMMIVDPAQTKLRIWLPESDNIDFDPDRPLSVVLDSDPRSRRSAELRFLANHVTLTRDGTCCFQAEAEWCEPSPSMRVGLQGTAILWGEKVSLGYWIMRRPLATARRYMGI